MATKTKVTPKRETMSIRGIIDNPTGSGSAYVYARSKIKRDLDSEFIYLLQRYRKQFSAKPVLYPDGRVLFLCRIPSGDYIHNKIVYDVFIEISNDSSRKMSLRNCQFLSNNMSFVYTYAYAFNQSGLLIDRFKDLLPSRCLTQYPSIRNPILSKGFERSLYFACRYLLDGMCLTSTYLRKYGIKAATGIDNHIRNQFTSMEKLQEIYVHTKDMQTQNHRREVNQARRAEREKLKQEYIDSRKQKNEDRYIRPARSRMSARKFKRRIINSR